MSLSVRMPITMPPELLTAQRRRVGWLLLAHLPMLLLALAGWGGWALGSLLALHALLLWGTLQPASVLFGPVLRRWRGAEQQIWLTIDDGPSADTLPLLAVLERHQAKATFFLVGVRAAAHPELVQAILAAGHELGNHSHTHPQHRFWCLPPTAMSAQILAAQQQLQALSGRPVRWFRAVVGHANPFVQPVLQALKLQRVGWSARAYDAVDGNVERVVRTLLRQIRPGSIVLLHEGAAHGRNVAMIDALLTALNARGYRAVLPP